jgi:hypothetical protein
MGHANGSYKAMSLFWCVIVLYSFVNCEYQGKKDLKLCLDDLGNKKQFGNIYMRR